jgi:uncharacterized alkaline shock family protein YloU
MSGQHLVVTADVVVDMVRLAAEEVPGVLRLGHGGPRLRRTLAPAPVLVQLRDGRADVRLTLIARPGHSLVGLCGEVRGVVASALERLLGLEAGAITVVVDGVGG